MFERLSQRHLPLVDAFCCVETEAALAKYNSKIRRRIKKHSEEMDLFLQEEAWEEQELGMNTTYLFLNETNDKILAYVSLCADAINLEIQEREDAGITYSSAPALKIARLAVDSAFVGCGLGTLMIEFSAYQAQLIREHAGIFFLTLDCFAHRLSFYESIGFVQNLVQPPQLEYDTPISMRLALDAYLETLSTHTIVD